VIYLDSSVVVAEVFAEDVHPEAPFWAESRFLASRLLEYEVWTRVHSRGFGVSHGDAIRAILVGVSFLELVTPVLARALEPFPVPVRTLDALHLATIEFLRSQGQAPSLATYDRRLSLAARALDIPLVDLAQS